MKPEPNLTAMFPNLTRSFGALLATALLPLALTAQHNVDIGMFRSDTHLEVRVRPHADFDGIFSNLVFAVRWERQSGASLGPIEQPNGAAAYMPLQRSGGIREDGPFQYQVYTGFGMVPISSTGSSWRGGEEYLIARIPFTGNAQFVMTNDQWTKQVESNADYFVSLGGHDRTGKIYTGTIEVNDQVVFAIMPNPTRGPVSIIFPVRPGEDMWYELISSSGQLVLTERPNAMADSYRKDLDLSGEGAGVYHLRVYRNGAAENHRIVVN
jgi:hypothetical protein